MKLSTRDLLWLTLVIGLILGLFAEEKQYRRKLKSAYESAELWQNRAKKLRKHFDFRMNGRGPSWPMRLGWVIEWEDENLVEGGVSIKRTGGVD